jgi:hypothetical protein
VLGHVVEGLLADPVERLLASERLGSVAACLELHEEAVRADLLRVGAQGRGQPLLAKALQSPERRFRRGELGNGLAGAEPGDEGAHLDERGPGQVDQALDLALALFHVAAEGGPDGLGDERGPEQELHHRVVEIAGEALPLLEGRELLGLSEEAGVAEGHRQVVGDHAEGGGILLVERALALHVQHPERFVAEQDGHRELGTDPGRARCGDVAGIGGHVVDELRAPLAHSRPHDAAGHGQPDSRLHVIPVVPAEDVDDERPGVLGIEQGDGHVRIAEPLVDRVGRALEQLTGLQAGGDDATDASEGLQALAPPRLALVAPGVLDGDRRVMAEQGEGLHVGRAEAPRGTSPEAEDADEPVPPEQGDPHHRVLRELRAHRAWEHRVVLEDDGGASEQDLPGEAHPG